MHEGVQEYRSVRIHLWVTTLLASVGDLPLFLPSVSPPRVQAPRRKAGPPHRDVDSRPAPRPESLAAAGEARPRRFSGRRPA